MKINQEKVLTHILTFNSRDAGVALIYDPKDDRYTYRVYCWDAFLKKELFSSEHGFLDDALLVLHEEFGSWELSEITSSSCSQCVAH